MGRLTDKYCIVGVGETAYTKNSGRTTRAMAVEAVRNAMRDAGLQASQVNGMLSYHGGDSCVSPEVASDLGIRLDFYMDCSGGGSSTEALIGLATGAIEVGMCETVAIFRSMNGYSEVRIGGTGRILRGGKTLHDRAVQPDRCPAAVAAHDSAERLR
jgi:acetyl-CoA acetyltransferase